MILLVSTLLVYLGRNWTELNFFKELNELGDRYVMWSSSLNYLIEDQWYGAGSGSWVYEIPDRNMAPYTSPMEYKTYSFFHAHNIFITVLSELGPQGFICFVGYFAIRIIRLLQNLAKDEFAFFKLTVIINIMLFGMLFGTVYPFRANYFPILFGVLIIICSVHHDAKDITIPNKKNVVRFLTIIILACSVWIIQNQIRQKRVSLLVNGLKGLPDKEMAKELESLYHPLWLSHSDKYYIPNILKNYYRKEGKISEAIKWQQLTLNQKPNSLEPQYGMAMLLANNNGLKNAMPYAQKAHRMNPYNYEIKILLAKIALINNDRQKAKDLLKFKINIERKLKNGLTLKNRKEMENILSKIKTIEDKL